MIAVSDALMALLGGGGFARADLYTITPVGQLPTRWTSADIDIAVDGQTYAATGAHFDRGRLKLARGLEVDTLDLSIAVDPAREPAINGVPLRQAAQKGLLDASGVALDWCYLASWAPPLAVAGVLNRFSGRAGAIEVTRTGIRMTVNSWLVLLDVKVPRQVYASGCRFTLGDGQCGVELAGHDAEGVAAAGCTAMNIPCQVDGADGAWDGGWVAFTSGACRGVGRAVRSFQAGVLYLTGPLPWAPLEGDSFTVYPGCDKVLPGSSNGASCAARFDNQARFGGMPFIPVPETAY